MGSVAYLRVVDKCAKIEKSAHAVIVTGAKHHAIQVNSGNLRGTIEDGRIKGLSRHALDRLRDTIARTTHKDKDYSVYGVCITIPWGSKDPNAFGNPTQEDAAKIWKRWIHHLGRFLDKWTVGIIYRVELQERKAVHWHMMVYLPNSIGFTDAMKGFVRVLKGGYGKYAMCLAKKRNGRSMIDCGGKDAHALILQMLRASWIKTTDEYHSELLTNEAWAALAAPVASGVAHAPFPDIKTFDYCFDAIPLDGVKSGIAYLASHTTKHKQDQLGYDGKQWGYLGKKWLCQPKPELLSIEGASSAIEYRARVRAFRLIRHWCKLHRAQTDWRVVRPSVKHIETTDGDTVDIYRGLVTRNSRSLYLFGTPPEVVSRAFDCALNQIGG